MNRFQPHQMPSSFRRKPESSGARLRDEESRALQTQRYWIPAFAGMTISVLLLTFSIGGAQAETAADVPQSSLFFTPQEARDAEMLATKSAPAGQGDINLGAVMFYGADDWTLWLRGERWTPQTVHEDLRVLGVTASEVHLLWREDAESPEREITLRPNQTYQIATGKIISMP